MEVNTPDGEPSERQRLLEAVAVQAVRQAALLRLSADLAAALDESEACRVVVDGLHDTLGYDFVALFLVDPITGDRVHAASAGDSVAPARIARGEGLSERPLLDGKSWTEEAIQLAAGDVLVLYTDGFTEACNEREELFGDERLLASVRACLVTADRSELSARHVQDAILGDVLQFAGNAPQSDDIALAVLMRK